MPVREKDKIFLGRGSPAEDLHLVSAEGSVLFDAQGRRYVDFVMGWCVGNLGWGNQDIREAIRRSKSPAYVHP